MTTIDASYPLEFCYACDKILEIDIFGPDDCFKEYENVLWIKFNGGYGQFVESDFLELAQWPEEYDADKYIYDEIDGVKVIPAKDMIPGQGIKICHECGHDLCDKIPWIEKLINPAMSHTHKTKYLEENPNHLDEHHPQQKRFYE